MTEHVMATLAAQYEQSAADRPEFDTSMAARSIAKGPRGERIFRFRHAYKPAGAVESAHCNVVVVETPGRATVLVAECQDNPGCSVTNAYELIAGDVHRLFLSEFDAEHVTWFEFYHRGLPASTPTLDRVVLQHESDRAGRVHYSRPVWTRIPLEQPSTQGATP